MAIKLQPDLLAIIKHHGEQTFPYECCGFLLGSLNNGAKCVEAALPVDNAREVDKQHNRFLITSEMYLAAETQARLRSLDVVGFYHSHPDAPARPSAYDTEHGWPWYSFVIVSVRDSKALEITSWVLRDDRSRFDEEKIDEVLP